MKTRLNQRNSDKAKLLYIENGKTHIMGYNKPFAVLQQEKSEYLRQDKYKSGTFRLTYC